MSNKPVLVFVPFILVGACGTGGGSLDALSYDELSTSLATLESDTLFTDLTDDATVDAIRGSVTYNGVIDIAVSQPGGDPLTGRQYLGQIEMTVDFVDESDAMTGSADNFFFYGVENTPPVDGTAVEGSLDIEGSTITSGNFFTGTASGEVEGVDAGGLFYGGFYGANAEGMQLTFQLGGTGSGSANLID